MDVDDDSNEVIDGMTKAAWDTDSSGWLAEGKAGVDHDFATDDVYAAAKSDGGVGSWSGWIWMGRPVEVIGSGQRDVEITYKGHMEGEVTAGGSGSADASVEAAIANLDFGGTNSDTIGYWATDRVGYAHVDESYLTTIQTELGPNDSYEIFVKVWVHIESQGVGLSAADFGYQDGDGFGGVHVGSFEIKKL